MQLLLLNYTFVLLDLIELRESFVTDAAAKQFLTRVNDHVTR